ncbi:MAG: response regulator [Massilibacteroides sp.]|nr:response regulator [Massilibacteroides sp.]MDD3062882.1 response regulator [Massilibacteroides sp.]MDD4114714.1 response regulator [Massilibacteroides sp.]MDD4660810.1 response regulator [Massilibacteroides sp.]
MKKSILILDDKKTIANVIAIYLSDEYDITYFENPILGIQWLQEGNIPDLIITDIYMPEMSGDEFLHFLKHNELFSSIPVIVLSGEESSDIRIRLLEEGAEDFILKPFNPLELKVRIKKAIH